MIKHESLSAMHHVTAPGLDAAGLGWRRKQIASLQSQVRASVQ
jgi:hypothetical protein